MRKIILLIAIGFCLLSSSCRVLYPNLMFKQQDYQYFEMSQVLIDEYTIQRGDYITLQIFSRDGFKIIDILEGSVNVQNASRLANNGYRYVVDKEGYIDIPVLGYFYVLDKTEDELENLIEEKFSKIYNEPFAVARVINKRVFLFKGSSASIVGLNDYPTTIFEVIARSGGIGGNLKAYNIKIIRGDLKNPTVHVVDLSTIESLREGELIVQTNDIIYIEARQRIVNKLVGELQPLIAIGTSLTALATLALTISTIGR